MSYSIVVVAGARPNFMKIAPILSVLNREPEHFKPLLVHTGQHYDYQMSEVFFHDLEIQKPDAFLNVVRDHPAQQTADIIGKFDDFLVDNKPDLVIVVGDVTSTAACALAASKREVAIAHVEAGLRSKDRTMPEEITRIITDALSDVLFTYSQDADENLQAENVPENCIFRVGNLMIDTLFTFREKSKNSQILNKLLLDEKKYILATLHRPSNVDTPENLSNFVYVLENVSERIPVVFQLHPRTRERLKEFNLISQLEKLSNIILIGPQGYLDIIKLQENSCLALTDSAGIAEETTALKIPCLTMRENTERPVTILQGSNKLVGCEPENIIQATHKALNQTKDYPVPPLWDGRSAERLVNVLREGVPRRMRT